MCVLCVKNIYLLYLKFKKFIKIKNSSFYNKVVHLLFLE